MIYRENEIGAMIMRILETAFRNPKKLQSDSQISIWDNSDSYCNLFVI